MLYIPIIRLYFITNLLINRVLIEIIAYLIKTLILTNTLNFMSLLKSLLSYYFILIFDVFNLILEESDFIL